MIELLHQPGDTLAQRYRIIAPLGQGAFATTYEAEDLVEQKLVALKAISFRQVADWKALDLFEREASVLATLDHRGIPKYLDRFHLDTPKDRCFYLVQELAPGKSLTTLVEQGWRTSEIEVKQIAAQVLEILDYLHSLTPPVIHRDIKPQNIVLDDEGKVYLVDFGAVQAVYRNTLSYSGTLVGTFGYMPPEQFNGQVKPASDLYALGATLVYLLSHRAPAELPQRRLKIDFRSATSVSRELARWLDKMLEPAIEDRFQSAKDALTRLPQKGSSGLFVADYAQPAGSCIELHQTRDRIIVDMPSSVGQWLGKAFPASKMPLVGLLLGAVVCLLVTQGSWLLIPVVALFGFSCLKFFSNIYLEINQQHFCLEWRIGNWSVGQTYGRTEVLDHVEVTRDGDRICCALVEKNGFRKHRFGSRLRIAEKVWLVGQLSNFLTQIRLQTHE